MKRRIIGIAVFVSMAVTVGVAADNCWNKIDGPCGGPSVHCDDFCRANDTQCKAPDVEQVLSQREYEDCVQPGVAWVNCDDRETPKLLCSVFYQCMEASGNECATPFTYECTSPTQTGSNVYWQTIETVFCGL